MCVCVFVSLSVCVFALRYAIENRKLDVAFSLNLISLLVFFKPPIFPPSLAFCPSVAAA